MIVVAGGRERSYTRRPNVAQICYGTLLGPVRAGRERASGRVPQQDAPISSCMVQVQGKRLRGQSSIRRSPRPFTTKVSTTSARVRLYIVKLVQVSGSTTGHAGDDSAVCDAIQYLHTVAACHARASCRSLLPASRAGFDTVYQRAHTSTGAQCCKRCNVAPLAHRRESFYVNPKRAPPPRQSSEDRPIQNPASKCMHVLYI